eukprot:53258-Pyramimonas_sp.AAC.1
MLKDRFSIPGVLWSVPPGVLDRIVRGAWPGVALENGATGPEVVDSCIAAVGEPDDVPSQADVMFFKVLNARPEGKVIHVAPHISKQKHCVSVLLLDKTARGDTVGGSARHAIFDLAYWGLPELQSLRMWTASWTSSSSLTPIARSQAD